MKKVVFALIVLIAFNAQAQDDHSKNKEHSPREHARKGKKMTPEQMATMRTKQLTLALDLDQDQQNKLFALNKQNAKEFKAMRGEKKEFTQEERFELKNKMLDKKIANQRAMKNILNENQYGKWKKMQKMRLSKMSKRRRPGSRGASERREHFKRG